MPTAERISELIDQVDADAPPLSDEQADAVAALLTGCRSASSPGPQQLRYAS
jgi:hypothetical protein